MRLSAAPTGRRAAVAWPDGWPACLPLTRLPGPMLLSLIVSGLTLSGLMLRSLTLRGVLLSGALLFGALLLGTLLLGTLLFGTPPTGPIASPAAIGPARMHGGGARAISGGASLTGRRARQTTTSAA